jgi:hydroxypyruvate isomerase
MPFEDMCRTAASLGRTGMDLVGNKDWPTLRKYGLFPIIAGPGPVTIKDGLIRKELHDMIEASMRTAIDDCAAAGCPNIITVGGQRRGMSAATIADPGSTGYLSPEFHPAEGHDRVQSLKQALEIRDV